MVLLAGRRQGWIVVGLARKAMDQQESPQVGEGKRLTRSWRKRRRGIRREGVQKERMVCWRRRFIMNMRENTERGRERHLGEFRVNTLGLSQAM